MREIKFRGYIPKYFGDDGKNGKWVYGYLTLHENGVSHIKDDKYNYMVLPKTVGQYTGLKDKNGVEIYEGDILLIILRTTIEIYNEKPFKHTVKISVTLNNNVPDWWFEVGTVEVIGNIHEVAHV